jgi:hypothetical protein
MIEYYCMVWSWGLVWFGLVWLIIMEMEECVVCVECALHSNRMLCNTRYSNDMITS